METTDRRSTDADGGNDGGFPAYGPLEAAFGYVLFYVLVDRVTPAVVETFIAVLDASPSAVGFGLAALLWFVLVVSAGSELWRQLAALGVVGAGDPPARLWSRVNPPALRTAGYLVALVGGAGVAAVTFERAVGTLLSLIPVVASATGGGVDAVGVVVLVVFFAAYGTATHSLDRLVVGTVRALTAE